MRLKSLIFMLLFQIGISHAGNMDALIALKEEPAGVVIELAKGSEEAITDVIGKVEQATNTIRARFPGISIAVVSHGSEQFALTSDKEQKYSAAHKGIKKIVSEGVNFHVCGTHASWRNISPEEYPSHIDVSPAGPAQINDYKNLGFYHLKR